MGKYFSVVQQKYLKVTQFVV